MDSTFNFEKKRLTPTRYNRNLMVKTVQAMQVVDKIREVRKERFAKQRLAAQLKKRKTPAERELAKHVNLLEGPTQVKALELQKEFEEQAKTKAKKKVKVERKA